MKADATALTTSLQDRKQRVVRASLAELAVGRLLAKGFDEVTIEELAESAGISRRTFFRYFPTKEDVVLCSFDEAGDELFAGFAARPRNESPLWSLRAAMSSITERVAREPAQARMMKLIRSTPALRAGFLIQQDEWRERLTGEIARRLPKDVRSPLIARLTAAVSLDAVDAAIAAWTDSDKKDIEVVLDDAFEALEAIVAPKSRKGSKPAR